MHKTENPQSSRWAIWTGPAVATGFALVVAGGARVAAFFAESMMSGVALIGSWLILAVGVAYAGVRLRPRLGGALLVGFGVGALIIAGAAGMQMLT